MDVPNPTNTHPSFFFFPHSGGGCGSLYPGWGKVEGRRGENGPSCWLAWDGEALQSPSALQKGNLGKKFTFFGKKKKAKNVFFFFSFLLVLLLVEKESSALEIYEISMKTRSLPLLGFTKTSGIHLCCNIPLPAPGQ